VCSVLLLAGAAPAHSEATKQKVERFVAAITAADKSAAHAEENLLQMANVVVGNEWRSVLEVADAYSAFRARLYSVDVLGTLSTEMDCRADRERAMEYFIASAQAAYKIANISLQRVNQALPKLTEPAAVSQAEKVRDTLQRERDLLASLGPAID
jgi:lipopolysaccharide biosynthesis regulator YciM